MNNRYTITDAANILGVHAHTLRYWEEELQLEIPRNELGHRVYYEEQIELFKNIKDLKEEGYQLNAIRMQVGHEIVQRRGNENGNTNYSASKEEKMQKFQELINEAVRYAIYENREEIGHQMTQRIIKEMNHLAMEMQNQEEERYRKLDEAIRNKVQKKKQFSWKVNQKEMAKKLKEELKNTKKEAVTECSKITT